ncbi:MAG: hypothetical protein GEV08_15900 [Acidimicrobiia bacterium]|nr:hypothetical protein [Acidimicrobiia bacterium]
MTALFARVFFFVGLAFLLGVVVGWLFWRYRRVSVADDDWSALRRELAGLHGQLDALQVEREVLSGQASRASAEVERLQAALTTAWHDRDVASLELHRASGALADARAGLERTTAQARYLQRRVTELSIQTARDRAARDAQAPSLVPGLPNGTARYRELPR